MAKQMPKPGQLPATQHTICLNYTHTHTHVRARFKHLHSPMPTQTILGKLLTTCFPPLLLYYVLTVSPNTFFLGRKLMLFVSFQFNRKASKLEIKQPLHTYCPVENEMITL